ncbi:MAG: HNH endonuclease [Janthinobacterium lividum]
MADDEVQARVCLAEADMPAIRTYTQSIASQVDGEIHRLRQVPDLAAVLPKADRGRRQPSAAVELEIYRRDGFRCRYCGCRIVHPKAQNHIAARLPGAVRWGNRDIQLNAAFYTLRGVLDHVVPHSNGGSSDPENLVVSCQPCNYGKGNYFIEQFGLSDPRLRTPHVDKWDGLRRVLSGAQVALQAIAPASDRAKTTQPIALEVPVAAAPNPATHLDEAHAAFNQDDQARLRVLIAALDHSSDLGVSWSMGRLLMVRMKVGSSYIMPLAVEADGTLQVPWFIGPHKDAFRSFTEVLAAAMPHGRSYETPKMWRVRCGHKMPTLADLTGDVEALREAFFALWNRLLKVEDATSTEVSHTTS